MPSPYTRVVDAGRLRPAIPTRPVRRGRNPSAPHRPDFPLAARPAFLYTSSPSGPFEASADRWPRTNHELTMNHSAQTPPVPSPEEWKSSSQGDSDPSVRTGGIPTNEETTRCRSERTNPPKDSDSDNGASRPVSFLTIYLEGRIKEVDEEARTTKWKVKKAWKRLEKAVLSSMLYYYSFSLPRDDPHHDP